MSSMARFRFMTDDSICCEVVTGNDTSRGAALVLLGFPATIGESPLTAFIVDTGFAVVQPHYAGTYDSAGAFTPESARSTVDSVVRALSAGSVRDLKSQQTRELPPEVTLCVGYSFGAHIAFHVLHTLNRLEHLLLLSPAVTYGDDKTGFESEDLEFMDYVKRSRPLTYRIGDIKFWKALFDGHDNHFTSTEHAFKVGAVVGSNDSSIDADKLGAGLPDVLERAAPNANYSKLLRVNGGGHSAGSLLNQSTTNRLKSLIIDG
jgi:pimeloyl-ACP methyl ester carboxylesterase